MRIEPRYPEGIKGINGYVKAECTINESGKVDKITVLESVPKGVFDKEALRALKRWIYKPAELNGKAVKTKHEVQLDWSAG
ncbi:hypothetical protein BTO11_02495 [Psychrosphaera saromensis]|uniref:TonB C-terminal domain-containing protein n=2 Tax=Psychrosphaera saromensis TaxID=716813 RepID=A0A2S7V0Q6_9GAMM|nr:hypothetical protein BTO11_02495 [Psychrosphaera saromensis]